MYVTLKDAESDRLDQLPQVYVQSLPTQLPKSQEDLYVPTPIEVYTRFAIWLLGSLAAFYLLVNQVVKVKRH